MTGQPTAAAWIAENGWGAYWERAWTFTSKSFWGVFGWLGVFMDARVYTLVYSFCRPWQRWASCFVSGRRATSKLIGSGRASFASPGMTLLLLFVAGVCWLLMVGITWVSSSTRADICFRHYRRGVCSLPWAGGAVLERRASLTAGGILLAVAGAHFVVATVAGGAADRWTVLLFGMAGAGMLLYGLLSGRISQLHRRHRSRGSESCFHWTRQIGYAMAVICVRSCMSCLFLAVVALDIAIPFLYIVPQLGS